MHTNAHAHAHTHPPPVLWNTYGECENYAVLKGHTGAVLEVQWNYDGRCVCGLCVCVWVCLVMHRYTSARIRMHIMARTHICMRNHPHTHI